MNMGVMLAKKASLLERKLDHLSDPAAVLVDPVLGMNAAWMGLCALFAASVQGRCVGLSCVNGYIEPASMIQCSVVRSEARRRDTCFQLLGGLWTQWMGMPIVCSG